MMRSSCSIVVLLIVFCACARSAPSVASGNTTLTCMICETAVVGAELALSSKPNLTLAEALTILHDICNSSFLAKYQEECEFLLAAEGDKIVTEIFNGDNGQAICSSIVPPLCPSPTIARAARKSAMAAVKRLLRHR